MTVDDVVTADCECVGVVPTDCPVLNANIGDSCDDGNADTINDEVQSDCSCEGEIPSIFADCPILNANVGDRCDDNNTATFNDRVQDDCNCAGQTADENLLAHWPLDACSPDRSYEDFSAITFNQPGFDTCLLYTSPSPRDQRGSRMPSSA